MNGPSLATVLRAIQRNTVETQRESARTSELVSRLSLDCCPEIYVDLKFYINLERRGGFYNYILILPCVLLSCLTCILFWLPVGGWTREEAVSTFFLSSLKVHRN